MWGAQHECAKENKEVEEATEKTVKTVALAFFVISSSVQLAETGAPLFLLIIAVALWGLYKVNGDLF